MQTAPVREYDDIKCKGRYQRSKLSLYHPVSTTCSKRQRLDAIIGAKQTRIKLVNNGSKTLHSPEAIDPFIDKARDPTPLYIDPTNL